MQMMIRVPEGDWPQAKQWMPVLTHGGTIAIVGCPKCGQPLSLHDHKVDFAGLVQPKLICPHVECRYKDFVFLADWNLQSDARPTRH